MTVAEAAAQFFAFSAMTSLAPSLQVLLGFALTLGSQPWTAESNAVRRIRLSHPAHTNARGPPSPRGERASDL